MIFVLKKFWFHLPWTEVIVLALLLSIVASILSIIFIFCDYKVGKRQADDFKNWLGQSGAEIYTWQPRSTFYSDFAEKVLDEHR